MGGEKVTWMVIKADLQCPCCYKKIKKLLCRFPQIQDQMFDEKKNLVTITVVCCSPESVRDKLCCKGGKVIQSIDILDPPKPKPPPPADKPKPPSEKPKVVTFEPPKPADNPPPPKPADKPKDPPKPADKPKDPPKPAADPPPKKPDPAPAPEPAKPKEPVFVPVLPPPQNPTPGPGPVGMYPVPIGYFGTQCYGPYGQCPCCSGGYGRPAPPPPCFDSNYGGGYGYGSGSSYGYSNFQKPCYASRCCDEYFNEDNTSSCSIM